MDAASRARRHTQCPTSHFRRPGGGLPQRTASRRAADRAVRDAASAPQNRHRRIVLSSAPFREAEIRWDSETCLLRACKQKGLPFFFFKPFFKEKRALIKAFFRRGVYTRYLISCPVPKAIPVPFYSEGENGKEKKKKTPTDKINEPKVI